MNYYADSNSPAYIKPETGQKVPGISSSQTVPSGCAGGSHPGCYDYKASADKPDDYDDYFTTGTAAQATTIPGAINADFNTFDPFGLGISELFTLHVTGTLTVPVSGEYTFAVNVFGGARFTLKDPSGTTLGGDPMIDSWGQVSNCSANFQAETSDFDSWVSESKALAVIGCVNSKGSTTASSHVELTAGVPYSVEMDGFMSWQPGPFQLLYTSNLFASEMNAVPGSWFATTQPGLAAPAMCAGRPATIEGTDGFDWLVGTNGDDVIYAGDGDDWIFGRGGRDVVCAGDGRDVVFGQRGADEIWGGAGEDRIRGGDGRDRISGGSGHDMIAGGFGSDRLHGGDGRDIIYGIDYEHWFADSTDVRDRDRAVGGRGHDRCLLVHPHRTRSCESDRL